MHGLTEAQKKEIFDEIAPACPVYESVDAKRIVIHASNVIREYDLRCPKHLYKRVCVSIRYSESTQTLTIDPFVSIVFDAPQRVTMKTVA